MADHPSLPRGLHRCLGWFRAGHRRLRRETQRLACDGLSAKRGLAAFRRAAGGVAAVEFALIVPFMVLIFVCLTELGRATSNYEKVIHLARTVSDLTSQGDKSDPISSATMTDILASSALVMRPFDSSGAKIVVSSVGVYTVSNALKPRICSSVATSNATARTTGYASDLTVPAGFQTDGMRYVLAEVSMAYTPMLGSSLTRLLGGTAGQFTFKASMPWPARNGTIHNSTYGEVTVPSGSWCP